MHTSSSRAPSCTRGERKKWRASERHREKERQEKRDSDRSRERARARERERERERKRDGERAHRGRHREGEREGVRGRANERETDLNILRLQLGRGVWSPTPFVKERPARLLCRADIVDFAELLPRDNPEQHRT